MGVSPRALAIRLVLWSVLFIWAVYKLHQFEASQIFVPPPPAVPTVLVASGGAPDPAAPPLVDPEAALAALGEATRALHGCGSSGTLTVRLGASGVEYAALLGTLGDEACAKRAITTVAWPKGAAGFELDGRVE